MDESKRYNGWTNYETWNVALWIDNEEGSYNYWREQAKDCCADQEQRHKAVNALADQLRDEIEEANPLAGQCSLYADILGANLREVNYHEIAEHWIDEVWADCHPFEFDDPAVNPMA